jgi:hypothetical protein
MDGHSYDDMKPYIFVTSLLPAICSRKRTYKIQALTGVDFFVLLTGDDRIRLS